MNVKSFNIGDYPYMVMTLLFSMLFAAAFIISPVKQRRPMLISALLATPCCFASIFFVPGYWDPVRIVTFIVGPEDLLFSFTTGGLAWFLATWPMRNYMECELRSRLIIRRYLICVFLGSTVNAVFLVFGFGVMISAIFGVLLVGTALLLWQKDLWPLQPIGLISFAVLYFIVIKWVFTVFPEFSLQWSAENLWGLTVWGIPLEEIAWAAACGAFWPFIAAYLFNVRLIPLSRLMLLPP